MFVNSCINLFKNMLLNYALMVESNLDECSTKLYLEYMLKLVLFMLECFKN